MSSSFRPCKLLGLCFGAASTLLANGQVFAEGQYTGFNRSLDDRYSLTLGAYFASVDTRYQNRPKSGLFTAELDLERLGLDSDETQPFLYGLIRFGDRWRLDLHAFGTDRDSSETAEFDVDLGEAGTIPVGVRVDTNFRAAIYAARVGYSFIRTPRAELGAGLGLHVTDLDVGIAGALDVGDDVVRESVSENAEVLAPLPTVGIYGAYAFTKTLSIEGQLGYFTLAYDKYDGSLLDAFLALEYRPFRHVGFGAGYNWLDADLDIDEDETVESYTVDFNGPVVYLKAGF